MSSPIPSCKLNRQALKHTAITEAGGWLQLFEIYEREVQVRAWHLCLSNNRILVPVEFPWFHLALSHSYGQVI